MSNYFIRTAINRLPSELLYMILDQISRPTDFVHFAIANYDGLLHSCPDVVPDLTRQQVLHLHSLQLLIGTTHRRPNLLGMPSEIVFMIWESLPRRDQFLLAVAFWDVFAERGYLHRIQGRDIWRELRFWAMPRNLR